MKKKISFFLIFALLIMLIPVSSFNIGLTASANAYGFTLPIDGLNITHTTQGGNLSNGYVAGVHNALDFS